MKPVISIVGARGMLGTEVTELLHRRDRLSIVPLDFPQIDITDSETFQAIPRNSICIINCSGFTDVDEAETKANEANRLNADGPKLLAEFSERIGAKLIHYSTDYIFDGTKPEPYVENDVPNPLNVYGRSKLQGENFIQQITSNHLILRTQWLYGINGKNFVDTISRLAISQSEVRVVMDQIGSPTWTRDLAKITIKAIEGDLRGTYHAVNRGTGSWFEVAQEIIRIKQIKTNLHPIASKSLIGVAPRPKNTRMDISKIEAALQIKMRHWKEALFEYCGS